MTGLEEAQKLAGQSYTVAEEDGNVVARFTAKDGVDGVLAFDASDPKPRDRAQCLDWSVRLAMGESPDMPAWMKKVEW